MSASPQFATTRWSLVLRAGQDSRPDAGLALRELCERYWYPLYAFLRREGRDEETALETVQAFIAQLLERGGIAAEQGRGRFRSYLIGALKHFVSSAARREAALRRGGGLKHWSIDGAAAEERYQAEPQSESRDEASAERLFERRWALQVLAAALARLRQEAVDKGREQLFALLEPALVPGAEAPDHAALARQLNSTEGAVKVAAHRQRRRLAALIRDEVRQTCALAGDLEDEVRLLFEALG